MDNEKTKTKVTLDSIIVKKIDVCRGTIPRSKIINDLVNLYIDDFLEGCTGGKIRDLTLDNVSFTSMPVEINDYESYMKILLLYRKVIHIRSDFALNMLESRESLNKLRKI